MSQGQAGRAPASLPLVAVSLPALVACVLFWPVLDLGYVWDDVGLYLAVPELRDASSFWAGTLETVNPGLHYFRPLALLSFKAQFLLLGDAPVAAHAIGLTLHAANTLLVSTLAARLLQHAPLTGARLRVTAAGLAYGLHPALVEPVSWMSCRFDLLVTFWLLLALHADLSLRQAWARAGLLAALFLCALTSKEMAAPFPAVLALFQRATRYRALPWTGALRAGLSGEWRTHAGLVAVLAGYFAMRGAFIGDAIDTDPDVAPELTGFSRRAAYVARTVLFYARLVVSPFDSINPLHPVDPRALASFGMAEAGAMVLVAALLAVLSWRVARGSLAMLLVAAALLSLVPVLNLVPLALGRNIGHERYLAFPLVLVALAVAAAEPPSWRASLRSAVAKAGVAAGIAWLALAAANVRVTVPLWRNDVTLWSWALARHPDSDYARYSLVTSLLRAGRPDLARAHVDGPGPATPHRALMRFEYAKDLLNRGEREAGTQQLVEALRAFPQWHDTPPGDARERRDFDAYRGQIGAAYTRLAAVQIDAREPAAALASVGLADFYSPGYPPALLAAAMALYALDEPERAAAVAAAAIQRSPPDSRAGSRLDDYVRELCSEAARPRRVCAAPPRWAGS